MIYQLQVRLMHVWWWRTASVGQKLWIIRLFQSHNLKRRWIFDVCVKVQSYPQPKCLLKLHKFIRYFLRLTSRIWIFTFADIELQPTVFRLYLNKQTFDHLCYKFHILHRCALHLVMYGLAAAARPWKPIPWSSLRSVPELIWRPHEVWRSVAIDSAESRRPLRTMRLSIRWPRSVILRGRPLRGWAAVGPNRFHSVIIPLTADWGIFSSEESCCTGGILSRYHAGIHWAPESDPFFHRCL